MRPNDEQGNLVERRPAETATAVAGAIGVIVSALIVGDYDRQSIATAVTVLIVAGVPAIVTWIVATRDEMKADDRTPRRRRRS